MKKISVLGSTGSIGVNTLDVIGRLKEEFTVEALVAGNDYKLLASQAIKVNAKLAVIANERHFADLKDLLSSTGIEVASGKAGVDLACDMNHDLVVAAIVGIQGLYSTYRCIKPGVNIALANKESLVCAGALIKKQCSITGSKLIPIDSEHNAIFQVFNKQNRDAIENITLTASGGPFRGYSLADLAKVSVDDALKHPNWSMGTKITIDSATMFNKGLEIIEASHLFDLREDQINVIVHPESIVHGFVNYKDGSSLAQLGLPDMRVAITYALHWPERYSHSDQIVSFVELMQKKQLCFEGYDKQVFRSIGLAREALKSGLSSPLILNSANEIAVNKFLNGQMKFIDIFKFVECALEKYNHHEIHDIHEVLAVDQEFKQKTHETL